MLEDLCLATIPEAQALMAHLEVALELHADYWNDQHAPIKR
jgi:hypothetical protein